MTKESIINNLKKVISEDLNFERVKEILTKNRVDGLLDFHKEINLYLICSLCNPEQLKKRNESTYAVFTQILDLKTLESLQKEIESLSSEDKLQIYTGLGDNSFLPLFVINNNDAQFCIDSIKNSGISNRDVQDLLLLNGISDEVKFKLCYDEQLDFDLLTKYRVAMTLKSDDYKLKVLYDAKMKEHAQYWSDIASLLGDDRCKRSLLRIIPAEKFKINSRSYYKIVNSIIDNEQKRDAILELSDLLKEDELVALVNSIKNDQIRTTLLDRLSRNFKKYELSTIISNYDDDKLKCEQAARYLFFDSSYIDVVMTCKDANNVISALSNQTDEKYLLSKLIHLDREDKSLICDALVPKLLPFISKEYGLNLDNIKYASDKYGTDFIRYLESDTLKKFINGSVENIDKLAYILSGPVMNMDDINNIYNCLLQKKFSLEKGDVISIFSRFSLAFDERNIEAINHNVSAIVDHKGILGILKDSKFLEELSKHNYKIDVTQESFSKFTSDLCNDIMKEVNFEKRQELKNLLHSITDYYIRTSREQYITSSLERMGDFLKLSKSPDKEKQLKLIFERVESEEIKTVINGIDKTKITDEETLYLLSPYGSKIIDACIKFKKNPREYQDEEIPKSELTSKYLKMFNGLMGICYEQKLLKGMCEDDEIMNFDVDTLKKTSIYDLMTSIDYDAITSRLFPFDDKVETLKDAFDKCKISSWGKVFDTLLTDIGFYSKDVLQDALINYGYKLADDLTISNIISFANKNAHGSIIYNQLFEHENCMFIINDPNDNKSHGTIDERIKKAEEYYKKMYERESITVPPMREIYEVDEEKKLKVTLGDVSNPINLTLGERTGACMRICGVGETLFDFCTLNESGFHIRFEEPDTGKFVSRVSGFRNGNTIFLNQLRHSCDINYSDDDLIEVLRKAAKDMIENSKNSEFPIDNVVISDGHAMENKENVINLGISDIKEGFENFYSDVDSSAILLASSNEDSLVPVKLSTNLPKYSPLRVDVKKHLDNDAAVKAVNHVKTVEKMLTGEPLDTIEPVTDAKIAITGEGWYAYIDQSGILHNKVIDGISEQRRMAAEIEMGKTAETLTLFVTNGQKGVGTSGK